VSKFAERLKNMEEERRMYALKHLPTHLAESGNQKRLQSLLTTFEFLQAKFENFGPQPLIKDYDYVYDDDLKLIQAAIRLSAHILADDPSQLASQLWGRLLSESAPAIQNLLKQVQPTFPWLRSLTPTLIAPGGPLLRTINAHSDSINAVAVTPDGRYAISTSRDKTLKVWDLESGTELGILKGHSDSVNAVAVTPEGWYAVSASSDHTLKLWDLSQRIERRTFRGHSDKVNAVAVTPDGAHAISASDDNTLKLWNLKTGYEIGTLGEHSAPINAVVVSPDGSRIVSASSDGSIKVWDLQTSSVLASFNADAKLNSCTLSPDGQTIVAGDELGEVHFLSLEDVKGVGEFPPSTATKTIESHTKNHKPVPI
jgi:WD40 repeat protein